MEKKPFEYVKPEEAGIPSRAIIRYLNAIRRQRICLHSLLIIRGGKIAYEANWAPMHSTQKHRMYSVSKSFVSVAIGLLASEGRISLDDPVIKYFPDKATAYPGDYKAKATIRDMLKMSSLFDVQPYDGAKDLDWISCFFNTKPDHESGMVHCYDTMATVLCTAIVERVSGQKLLDYLRPRLLDPIGFSEDAWCVETPCGLSWAGSGIMCTTRDLAKFANVVMHGGEYEGKQLLPADYIREATSYQISNMVNDNSIQQGYGYQFWRFPENGFGCVGMGSQLAVCLPDRDLILVTTGDTQELEARQYAAFHLFYDLVLPEIEDGPVAAVQKDIEELKERTEGLVLQLTPGMEDHPVRGKADGVLYRMDTNPLGWTQVRFTFDAEDASGTVHYTNARGEKEIQFGFGKQVIGEFPETHYSGRRISEPKGTGYRYAASAGWDTAGALTVYCYIIDDYFGTLKMTFAFSQDGRDMTLYASKVAEWFLDDYVGTGSGHAVDA